MKPSRTSEYFVNVKRLFGFKNLCNKTALEPWEAWRRIIQNGIRTPELWSTKPINVAKWNNFNQLTFYDLLEPGMKGRKNCIKMGDNESQSPELRDPSLHLMSDNYWRYRESGLLNRVCSGHMHTWNRHTGYADIWTAVFKLCSAEPWRFARTFPL